MPEIAWSDVQVATIADLACHLLQSNLQTPDALDRAAGDFLFRIAPGVTITLHGAMEQEQVKMASQAGIDRDFRRRNNIEQNGEFDAASVPSHARSVP